MPNETTFLFPVLLAALVARLGFMLYATGLVRSRHAAATAGRSLLDLCFSLTAFYVLGAAFVGASTHGVFTFDLRAILGIDGLARDGQLAVVVLGGAILTGTLAERCGFWPNMLAAVALGAVALPLPILWTSTSNGWLAKWNVGGIGAAFSIAAAAFAAVGAWMIGPRLNKYQRDGSTSLIPGHNLPLATIGAIVATIGLLGLIGGFPRRPDAALVAVAVAGVAATVATQLRFGKPDVGLILGGLLGAAVAVNAAGSIPAWSLPVVGLLAGLVVPHVAFEIDTRFKLDDPIAGVSIFGAGGVVGMVAAGLFRPTEHVMTRLYAVGANLLGVVAIVVWAGLVAVVTFALLKKLTRLRVKEGDEFDGLDLAEHDVAAYPDFQQNTIRSFHMREA